MPNEGTSPPAPSGHHPANSLANRTYIGLLVAQFLAAFNDQAIHASAMFFAINTQTLTEASAISLMPILFYAPWALFCTLAGFMADRFSKRVALVFWKFAEIAITALAFLGFWLGTHGHPHVGSWIVLSTVFLMGTHSAFFVPAKYGVMPEILRPHLLSKGNGLLESLSFLAVILGTVAGGVLSFLFLRHEYIIGIILCTLALIGAIASVLIHRMPAANPTLPFPRYLYQPLFKSLRTLFSSKALIFAVIGISFFTFVVAFMRATVYMLGESQNPRWDELRTSVVVGTVALGIGLGSPLAGWLSGRKVELGLILIGGLGMVLGCTLAAFMLDFIPGLVVSIVLIGFSTGFYLVPLFTLLQHRAPTANKGDIIATSNFINVTGAIAASTLFFVLVFLARKIEFVEKVPQQDGYASGELTKLEIDRGRPVYFEVHQDGQTITGGSRIDPAAPPPTVVRQIFGNQKPKDGTPTVVLHVHRGIGPGDDVIVSHYELRDVHHFKVRRRDEEMTPSYDSRHLPRFLFLGAGTMTLATLLLLWLRLPDLSRRARWVIRCLFGPRAIIGGMHHLPADGPIVLATMSSDRDLHAAILSATDRSMRIFTGDPSLVDAADLVLRRGNMVGLVLEGAKGEEFLRTLSGRRAIEIVPVFAERLPGALLVCFGAKVAPTISMDDLRERIAQARHADDH